MHLQNKLRIVLMPLLVLVVLTQVHTQDLKKEFPESFTVKVTNPLDRSRNNVIVNIPQAEIGKFAKSFNRNAFVVLKGQEEIPAQFNNNDKVVGGIALVLDEMKAKEVLNLTVRFKKTGEAKRNYTKRTQAELSHKFDGKFVNREYVGGNFKNVEYLRVPKEHKDHSWFIRYEGPGWESDKVGYRFYLDQRNATDVFGKKTTAMVLQEIGKDGFDSYHEMQSWGMDVMKVGKSLGVGSIGYVANGTVSRVEKTDSVDCKIIENGDVYSSIRTQYFGWEIPGKKISLESVIGIHAGERYTRQTIFVIGDTDRLCTGIVKDINSAFRHNKGDANQFGYIATYGKQSLNDDNLGLAVLFPASAVSEFSEDENSHLVDLKVFDKKIEYYFLAAWAGETDGIKNESEFYSYLVQVAQELAQPVKVSVAK